METMMIGDFKFDQVGTVLDLLCDDVDPDDFNYRLTVLDGTWELVNSNTGQTHYSDKEDFAAILQEAYDEASGGRYGCNECDFRTNDDDEMHFTKDAMLCADCYAESDEGKAENVD